MPPKRSTACGSVPPSRRFRSPFLALGTMPQQLPIDYRAAPSFEAAAFVVSTSNAAAFRLLGAWPRWPQPVVVLHGPAGSGKSHLAAIWQAKAEARAIALGDLGVDQVPSLLGDARAVLIEDAAAIAGVPEREQALLHLYNLVLARAGTLLLTAAEPPSLWPIALADLASRLRAGLPVRIDQPDDALLGAVLRKHFADRQLSVGDDVVGAALLRMERSFHAARALAAALDYASLAQKRPITSALLREVLAAGAAGA
jgi:chromosomal replication initiation ATPase DnaA